MTTETKRRLILSKWRGSRDEVATLRAEIKELEIERDDALDDRDSIQNERNALQSQLDEREGPGMREALTDVKYWMHAAQFRRSWPLLRKIEDALG